MEAVLIPLLIWIGTRPTPRVERETFSITPWLGHPPGVDMFGNLRYQGSIK